MKKIFKLFICVFSFSMFFACTNQSSSSSSEGLSSSLSEEVSTYSEVSSELLSSESSISVKDSFEESEEVQTSPNETLSGHLNHSSKGEGPIIDWEN